jgi:hypothetical protein
MQKTELHIGFTGHRPNKLGGYDLSVQGYIYLQKDLETYIKRNLDVFDVVVGHSGLALGGGTVWSKAILGMTKKNPTCLVEFPYLYISIFYRMVRAVTSR